MLKTDPPDPAQHRRSTSSASARSPSRLSSLLVVAFDRADRRAWPQLRHRLPRRHPDGGAPPKARLTSATCARPSNRPGHRSEVSLQEFGSDRERADPHPATARRGRAEQIAAIDRVNEALGTGVEVPPDGVRRPDGWAPELTPGRHAGRRPRRCRRSSSTSGSASNGSSASLPWRPLVQRRGLDDRTVRADPSTSSTWPRSRRLLTICGLLRSTTRWWCSIGSARTFAGTRRRACSRC